MSTPADEPDPPRLADDLLGFLEVRPIVVAVAGSNGSGKTTFYHSHLADTALRFVNADDLAQQLAVGPYEAAEIASSIRGALIEKRESFIFETVLSDPIGDKTGMLTGLAQQGYTIVLIFIQIDSAATSIDRVAMRAAQGGHDVPDEKLLARFGRTRANLQRAIEQLPHVIVYDNSNLSHPFRLIAVYEDAKQIFTG